MKVEDVMTCTPRSCSPDASVAAAARQLWEGDCGILPVVDDGELVGVVTDRDMYIALATTNERASHVRVGAVATRQVSTCAPGDDVSVALERMKRRRVRRLPVVTASGALVGIVSLTDIVRAAGNSRDITSDAIVETIRAICATPDAATRR
jgi:CBS domain-containing protein